MRVIYVNVIGLEITKIWTGVLIWNLNKNIFYSCTDCLFRMINILMSVTGLETTKLWTGVLVWKSIFFKWN